MCMCVNVCVHESAFDAYPKQMCAFIYVCKALRAWLVLEKSAIVIGCYSCILCVCM